MAAELRPDLTVWHYKKRYIKWIIRPDYPEDAVSDPVDHLGHESGLLAGCLNGVVVNRTVLGLRPAARFRPGVWSGQAEPGPARH